jgi:hypothetical protein
MRLILIGLLASSVGSGCAFQQLKFSTVRQNSTLPDIQERQVIENFARLAANAGALPYYAIANQGATTVLDSGTNSLALTAVHKAFPSWSITPYNINRSITESWQTVPENNPDRIKAMRAAYLSVINPNAIEPRDGELFRSAVHGDPSYAIRQGWLCTGSWWEVPKHAWMAAHCGPVYVWVMPENAAEFSRFVLMILHIETVTPGSGGGPGVPGTPGVPGAALEALSPAAPASPFPPRLFDAPTGVNSGLFFVPRPPGR